MSTPRISIHFLYFWHRAPVYPYVQITSAVDLPFLNPLCPWDRKLFTRSLIRVSIISDNVFLNVDSRIIGLRLPGGPLGHLYNFVTRTWAVSDRVAVMQMKFGDKPNSIISIINIYAPTGARVNSNPEELDEFYSTLMETYNSLSSYKILIADDWNARAGRARFGETCIGSHGRNRRNSCGESLIQFCSAFDLFISNTAFDHRARHKTTWTGARKDKNGNIYPIYNQIDYIICRRIMKNILSDARSYDGLETSSDHKLVVTRIVLKRLHGTVGVQRTGQMETIDTEKLVYDKSKRIEYSENLRREINKIDISQPANIIWTETVLAMKKTSLSILGPVHKRKYLHNNLEIESFSIEQKRLRLELSKTLTANRKKELKTQRGRILKKIKTIQKRQLRKEVEEQVAEIEKYKDGTRMFQPVRLINRGKRTNYITVHDKLERTVISEPGKTAIISEYFHEIFNQNSEVNEIRNIQDTRIISPINITETMDAIKKLNCKRSPGPDNIPAELLKFDQSSWPK
ncbi:uncharacterized protein LOC115228525 [Octopus sinensis]|uniref:Uncharacterized protein LOC115228525 n=1 Tax=Octopus sinensis TaxID=2607531 RepID=A0A6P7TRV3_9MOLL|nr:uncharacterized protein LOC115228525 [Octopus sinensis]